MNHRSSVASHPNNGNPHHHQMHQAGIDVQRDRGMEISDNDVLIDGDDDRGFKLIDDNHVGNKRFEVFLQLYQEEYNRAMLANSVGEMARIVDTILDIVCRKCVRRGRFLERVSVDTGEEGMVSEWYQNG